MIDENGFKPTWFVGIVEFVEPQGDGRLKVRAFGFHPPATTGEVTTEDLPWAYIVNNSFDKMSIYPEVGTYVVGFFIDGRDAGTPMILGSISTGMNTSLPGNARGNVQDASYRGASVQSGNLDHCQAYDHLRNSGLSHNQAIGVMANISRESGFNSGIHEIGGGGGIGLFQYTYPSRKNAFIAAVPDWQTNPVGQIQYAINSDPQGRAFRDREFGSALEAADAWLMDFENPATYIKDQYVSSRGGTGNRELVNQFEQIVSTCRANQRGLMA